jgi:hypothetical protein
MGDATVGRRVFASVIAPIGYFYDGLRIYVFVLRDSYGSHEAARQAVARIW